jgi:hypothetical protein
MICESCGGWGCDWCNYIGRNTKVSESTETLGYKGIEPISSDDELSIKWLLKNKNHGLDFYGLISAVRILINKVNELTSEVNRMKFL